MAAIDTLRLNLRRVDNLIRLYTVNRTAGAGRKDTKTTDLLRAAVVVLHASMEDYLRSLRIAHFDAMTAEQVACIPLVSPDGNPDKGVKKFTFKELYRHKERTVGDLMRESLEENLEAFSSYSDVGQVITTLQTLGINDEALSQEDRSILQEMIKRRHNIVHKADRNQQRGQGNYRTKSIGPKTVESYVGAVKALVRSFGEEV